MKNRIICVVACLMMLVGCVVLCSCSEADKVNRNISKQANYFEAERRITVYNARTDNVILEMEGAMSISNNDNNELVCTVKTGPNEYKKNYIYLNEYTMYVVEDILTEHGRIRRRCTRRKSVVFQKKHLTRRSLHGE